MCLSLGENHRDWQNHIIYVLHLPIRQSIQCVNSGHQTCEIEECCRWWTESLFTVLFLNIVPGKVAGTTVYQKYEEDKCGNYECTCLWHCKGGLIISQESLLHIPAQTQERQASGKFNLNCTFYKQTLIFIFWSLAHKKFWICW